MSAPDDLDPVLWQQAVEAAAAKICIEGHEGCLAKGEHLRQAQDALAAALPVLQQVTRTQIADEIRQKIGEWRPDSGDNYIRGMHAALLYVTGEAHRRFISPGVAPGETPA